MIDRAYISVKSGRGGNGLVSGRREKFVPYGGPDGGDGGDGGSVYISCDESTGTLQRFRYKQNYNATSGGNGSRVNKHGAKGEDIDVLVPVGTQVWLEDDEPILIADLAYAGNRIMVASGGNGGRGNSRFATSRNQFPLLAEEGEASAELSLRLDLKLIADIGLVGAPNAGKSSLLAALTAAHPKIAGYPFTTLEPVLGVLERGAQTIVIVDIPGLIEGAHEGVGLGDQFLRHIERTRVLVHLIDGSADDPVATYHEIRKEMEQFGQGLTDKPQIIAINKTDMDGVSEMSPLYEAELKGEGYPFCSISAAGRLGLDELIEKMMEVLLKSREESAPVESQQIPILNPVEPRREQLVSRVGGELVVTLSAATRLAGMTDPNNWEARLQLYDRLRKMGVIKALEEAGIEHGDIFKVGKLDWEWE
jgi:GTP-binding protein